MNRTQLNTVEYLTAAERETVKDINAQSLRDTLDTLRALDAAEPATGAAVADFSCRAALFEIGALRRTPNHLRAARLDRAVVKDINAAKADASERAAVRAEVYRSHLEQGVNIRAAGRAADAARQAAQFASKFGVYWDNTDLRGAVAAAKADAADAARPAAERRAARLDNIAEIAAADAQTVTDAAGAPCIDGVLWKLLERAEKDIRAERKQLALQYRGYCRTEVDAGAGADAVYAVINAFYDAPQVVTLTQLLDAAGRALSAVIPQLQSLDALDYSGADYEQIERLFTGASVPCDNDAFSIICERALKAADAAAAAALPRRLTLRAADADTDGTRRGARIDATQRALGQARIDALRAARPMIDIYLEASRIERAALYSAIAGYSAAEWAEKHPDTKRAYAARRACRALTKAIHAAERAAADAARQAVRAAERAPICDTYKA